MPSGLIEDDDDSIADGKLHRVAINLLYGFDGSNWERIQTDGSGKLKVDFSSI